MSDVLRPAPGILAGERIIVRPFGDDDAPLVWTAIDSARAHLQPWFPWVQHYHAPEDALGYVRTCEADYLLRRDFLLGIFLPDGRFAGGTGLHPRDWDVPAFEIGYWIHPEFEGRGYVGEAVRLLTVAAFARMGAQRLMIRCNARNERSRRVAERNGFTLEGCLRNMERSTDGELADMLFFSMLPPEFDAARQNWANVNGGSA